MKKILLAISLIFMLFFVGCSSSEDTGYYTTTSTSSGISEYYRYNLETFKVNSFPQNDIMSYLKDDVKDFYIVISGYSSYYLEEVTEETVSKLYLIVSLNPSVDSLGELLNNTASDLNTVATEVGVVLTVEDIVGFINLKDNITGLRGTRDYTLEEYIKLRLNRRISSVEKLGIESFVDAYMFLVSNDEVYDFTSKTFIEIIADLDNLGYEYTGEELASIEVGFDLLIEVINN